MHSRIVVIAGPTGTGKSDLALRLAHALPGEIVNFDSVQVYRGFDIGSAKPRAGVRAEVPHHLFDVIDAGEEFNAADFARVARPLCESILGRSRTPLLVGGTFFYLRALLAGLPELPGREPELRARIRTIATRPRGPLWLHRWLSRVDQASGARIAPRDRHRVERALEVWLTTRRPISETPAPSAARAEVVPSLKIGLRLERPRLNESLDRRVEEMYRNGLVDEARLLLDRYDASARPFTAIGYREAVAVVKGEMQLDEAIAETKRRTRAYAKRQMTWLRSERNVQWIDASDREMTFAAALRLIEVGT